MSPISHLPLTTSSCPILIPWPLHPYLEANLTQFGILFPCLKIVDRYKEKHKRLYNQKRNPKSSQGMIERRLKVHSLRSCQKLRMSTICTGMSLYLRPALLRPLHRLLPTHCSEITHTKFHAPREIYPQTQKDGNFTVAHQLTC